MKNIEIISISKTFRAKDKIIQALDNVSFSVEKGDIYGIIGLSGSGKSTLIRCMASLLQPSSGRILFEGKEIQSMTPNQLRQFRLSIGMVFQHFNLFSSHTALENVSYPLEIFKVPFEERQKRAEELLELVGLFSKKNVYPSFLSGGEKQRVGIARALSNQPKILLCDEATSALDPKTTSEVLNLLKMIHKKMGITVVLVTHQMEVVKSICNKVAVMEEGSIIEQGLVSEVFANPKHTTTKQLLQKESKNEF